MRLVLRAAVIAVLGFFVLPAFAADDKKPDDKKTDEKKPDDKVAAGAMAGKILHVDQTKHTLKVQLDVPEINQGEYNAIVNDTNQIQNALNNERPSQGRTNKIINLQNSIARHQQNLYKIAHKDVELTTTEDVKVRLANPPPKFDDKGKAVAYTKDELKEMKGDDPKAIGYKAEFSDLREHQLIKVVLMKKKGKPTLPKPEPGTKLDPSQIADAMAEFEPKVTTIVIVAEPK